MKQPALFHCTVNVILGMRRSDSGGIGFSRYPTGLRKYWDGSCIGKGINGEAKSGQRQHIGVFPQNSHLALRPRIFNSQFSNNMVLILSISLWCYCFRSSVFLFQQQIWLQFNDQSSTSRSRGARPGGITDNLSRTSSPKAINLSLGP